MALLLGRALVEAARHSSILRHEVRNLKDAIESGRLRTVFDQDTLNHLKSEKTTTAYERLVTEFPKQVTAQHVRQVRNIEKMYAVLLKHHRLLKPEAQQELARASSVSKKRLDTSMRVAGLTDYLRSAVSKVTGVFRGSSSSVGEDEESSEDEKSSDDDDDDDDESSEEEKEESSDDDEEEEEDECKRVQVRYLPGWDASAVRQVVPRSPDMCNNDINMTATLRRGDAAAVGFFMRNMHSSEDFEQCMRWEYLAEFIAPPGECDDFGEVSAKRIEKLLTGDDDDKLMKCLIRAFVEDEQFRKSTAPRGVDVHQIMMGIGRCTRRLKRLLNHSDVLIPILHIVFCTEYMFDVKEVDVGYFIEVVDAEAVVHAVLTLASFAYAHVPWGDYRPKLPNVVDTILTLCHQRHGYKCADSLLRECDNLGVERVLGNLPPIYSARFMHAFTHSAARREDNGKVVALVQRLNQFIAEDGSFAAALAAFGVDGPRARATFDEGLATILLHEVYDPRRLALRAIHKLFKCHKPEGIPNEFENWIAACAT